MRVLSILMVLPMALLFASCGGPTYNGIAAAEFNTKVSSGDYHLIDMYKPKEGRTEMIAGARLLNAESKEERVALKELGKDKEVLLYCTSGKGAERFMQHLESVGFTKVSQLEGGLNAWKREGLPVVAIP